MVTFNISAYRSDALLLTAFGISCVNLPALSPPALIEQINTFHRALREARDSGDLGGRIAAQRKLLDVLGWLWDAAAGPVLDALGYGGTQLPDITWPRVWWAPGGLLGLLPLHAAGHHSEPAPRGQPRSTVMDRIVSSYTPTIRALRYSRQHADHPDGLGPALIVAMPTTPGQSDLPDVPAEVAMVRAICQPPPPSSPNQAEAPWTTLASRPGRACSAICPAARSLTSPVTVKATRATHPTAGYCFITTPVPRSPSPASQRLTMTSSSSSTCRPAVPPSPSPRNCWTRPSTSPPRSSFAGSRHVIGTLWDVGNAVAADIAATFYTGLRTSTGIIDTDRAAFALHHAVRAVRDKFPHTPSLWASHLHAGA